MPIPEYIMDADQIRYDLNRKKAYCRDLIRAKGSDHPETVELVAKIMAEVRLKEALLNRH